jgi:3-oxoacyl-[acyl-carrier protein] reductase
MGRLDDKVAIITGAGQGIGLAYAERFLAEGAKVVVGEINEDRAETAMKQLDGKGDAVFVQTDIADEQSAKACANATVDHFGTIDVLLNNRRALLRHRQRRQHVLVPEARLRRELVRRMADDAGRRAHDGGEEVRPHRQPVVRRGVPLQAEPPEPEFTQVASFSYSMTKWGVIGLTKFMASQLGQHGITVNCIAPGVTMTEATKKIVPEEYIGMIPMMSAMKQSLEPEDIAGTAVFFASEDGKLVTGQVLCVDGGTCMPG